MHRLIAYGLTILIVTLGLLAVLALPTRFALDDLRHLPMFLMLGGGIIFLASIFPFALLSACDLRFGLPAGVYPVAGMVVGAMGGAVIPPVYGSTIADIAAGAVAGLAGGAIYRWSLDPLERLWAWTIVHLGSPRGPA
jgi:hypothetical protein